MTQVITGGRGMANPDCTASVTLEVSIGGMPAPDVSMTGVILAFGDEILAFSEIPGTTATCHLKRIRR